MTGTTTSFAPLLYIPNGVTDISFYEKAFGAVELRRFSNADGSIHVSELTINGAMFHLHEANAAKNELAPADCNGTHCLVGLFVPNVDSAMASALTAGATEIAPATDFDYGYRQGELKDPFGHHWVIQQTI